MYLYTAMYRIKLKPPPLPSYRLLYFILIMISEYVDKQWMPSDHMIIVEVQKKGYVQLEMCGCTTNKY